MAGCGWSLSVIFWCKCFFEYGSKRNGSNHKMVVLFEPSKGWQVMSFLTGVR